MKMKLFRFLGSVPVQFLCRFILGGLFIYAGIGKVSDPAGFAQVIYEYRLVPDIFIHLMAVVLPWLEIFSGMLLVAGIFTRTSSIIITGLIVVFIIALSINVFRGFNLDCGCFSTTTDSPPTSLVSVIVRDIFLLLPGLVIIFFHRPTEAVKFHTRRQ